MDEELCNWKSNVLKRSASQLTAIQFIATKSVVTLIYCCIVALVGWLLLIVPGYNDVMGCYQQVCHEHGPEWNGFIDAITVVNLTNNAVILIPLLYQLVQTICCKGLAPSLACLWQFIWDIVKTNMFESVTWPQPVCWASITSHQCHHTTHSCHSQIHV